MSRTIQEIQNQIIETKESYSELDQLNSPSQTSIWRLWTFITAVSISFLEQIIDIFKSDIEVRLTNKVAGTRNWIENNVRLFQYSSTDPQIIEISDTYEISYPTYNEDLQIIKQVAIDVLSNNLILVKVAKNSPPEPLNLAEKTAFDGYLTEIMPAGIQTSIISENSDKIYLKGEIFYNSMYSSIIQSSVELKINNYLENLIFGGRFVLTELVELLLDVPGVNDVVFTRVTARRDSISFDTFNNKQIYILEGTSSDINNRFYNTYSGYIITENTTGYTISDSITYTAQ